MSKVTYKQEDCICPYCGSTNFIYIGVPILDSEEICLSCKKAFLCHIEPIIYSTFLKDDQ